MPLGLGLLGLLLVLVLGPFLMLQELLLLLLVVVQSLLSWQRSFASSEQLPA